MIDSIYAINNLSPGEKEGIYKILIPHEVFLRYQIDPDTLKGNDGERLVRIHCTSGLHFMRIELKRKLDDRDPVFSLDLSDTRSHQIELSFIIINDVESERFNIDIDDEGRDTYFGTYRRNLKEEERAMKAGLGPGQVRKGLRMIGKFFPRMEEFVTRGNALVKNLALNAEVEILIENSGTLATLAENLLQERDVQRVKIMNENKQVLVDLAKPGTLPEKYREPMFLVVGKGSDKNISDRFAFSLAEGGNADFFLQHVKE